MSLWLLIPTTTAAPSPPSAPAAVISEASSAQQVDTILSQTTILSSVTTQAPSVEQVVAATTEFANTSSASTAVSAAVLIGTPLINQTSSLVNEAQDTPAPAAPATIVAPGTPSARLVSTAKAVLQSELSTLLTAAMSQASSVIQIATPTVKQSSALTADPTAPVAETSLKLTKRWNWQGRRHGYLNKP